MILNLLFLKQNEILKIIILQIYYSESNFELEGGLNGSDPIFGH